MPCTGWNWIQICCHRTVLANYSVNKVGCYHCPVFLINLKVEASYRELLYHKYPRTQYSSTGQLLSRETRPSGDIHLAHPRESTRPSLLLGTLSSPPWLICHDWSSKRVSGIWYVSQSKMLGRIYFSAKKSQNLIAVLSVDIFAEYNC